MELFLKYLVVQLKRIKKALPSSIVTTLLLFGCVVMIAGMILWTDASSESKQKIQVGLVGETEGTYLGVGITALQNLDSTRFTIDFLELTEPMARRMLNNMEINAYVVIPDGFLDSIVRGSNLPLKYVTTPGAVGLGTKVMNELIDTISTLLTESQSAMYGMQRMVLTYGEREQYNLATAELFMRFTDFIIGRTMIYNLEVIGISQNLSLVGYYLCGLTILFLLLWGITGSRLFVKREVALSRLLAAKGQCIVSQTIAEYMAYLTLMTVTMLVVMILLFTGMRASGFNIPEWRHMGIAQVVDYTVHLFPAILAIAALQFLLSELSTNPVNGMMLQFLCALGFGYITGCFYPLSFFPDGLQKLQPYLPSGAAMNYCAKGLQSKPAGGELLLLLLYTVVFLTFTYIVRRRRIQTISR